MRNSQQLSESALYVLSVRNRMLDRWHALEEEYPEEMQQIKAFLKQHPTNIHVTNGKAKKLRGRLRGIYQFDVSYTDRVRYRVDKTNHRVEIVFAKGHP